MTSSNVLLTCASRPYSPGELLPWYSHGAPSWHQVNPQILTLDHSKLHLGTWHTRALVQKAAELLTQNSTVSRQHSTRHERWPSLAAMRDDGAHVRTGAGILVPHRTAGGQHETVHRSAPKPAFVKGNDFNS